MLVVIYLFFLSLLRQCITGKCALHMSKWAVIIIFIIIIITIFIVIIIIKISVSRNVHYRGDIKSSI